jgi:hypothetical protein
MSQQASSRTVSISPAPAKYPFFPDNEEFWFEAQRAFGAASYGASEFGEVMTTVGRIASGDYDGWYNEWDATAERVFAEAEAQRAAGHRVSARDGYLRAAAYFRTSEFFLHGNHEDPRIYSAYETSINAYKLGCPLYDPPILPVEIPHENTTLPGLLPSCRRARRHASAVGSPHGFRWLSRRNARFERTRGCRARLERPGLRRSRPVRPDSP